MKNIIKISVLVGVCGILQSLSPLLGSEISAVNNASAAGNYLGENLTNPIKLDPQMFKNFDMIEAMQDDYIRERYEDWRIRSHMFMMFKGHFFTAITIEKNDGVKSDEDVRMFFFYMDDIYKQVKRERKDSKKVLKEMEDRHRPLLTEDQLRERQRKASKQKSL